MWGEMDKRGVTLVELIIVVAILGILAMVAIPGFVGQGKKAMRTEAYSNLQVLRLLEEQYNAENGCYFVTGGVCTNQAIATVLNAGAVSFAHLPKFNPGQDSSLNYTYSITTSTAAGAGVASAFVATATGKAGTRVAGDAYTIDNNNNRNF
jgi:type IV pilus assembly protein PilE